MDKAHNTCLFCKIANKTLESKIVHESKSIIAFHDINAQAPVHVLLIPKRHIATLNELKSEDANLVAELHLTAVELAKKLGLADDGYRLVFNCNKAGGQEVYHIHLHLLGGRQLTWPPG